MGGAKDTQSAVDCNKKWKTVNPIWRPVFTQASSHEECLVKDVKVMSEDGSQVQAAHCSISSCVSNVQHVNMEAEVVNELTDSTISSRALHNNDEDTVLEKGPMLSAEKHSISVEVGASLFRFIKGKGGSIQKKIEEEMGVKIIFPSSKKEDSLIIEGISIESVTRASQKIQAVIDELVNFQNSILGNCDPNPDENLGSHSNEDTSDDEDKGQQKGLGVAVELRVEDDNAHVKADITNISLTCYPPKASKSSSCSEFGIDKSIFIKPKTFHLTVLMLKLWNKDRVDAAADVLRSVSSKVMGALDSRPVSVKLKGLDCMRGSLEKARVLYAPVEEVGSEDRLLRACQVIIDAYVEAGLVLEKDAKQKLKLHATVMNARHRKRKKRSRKLDSFNAQGIVKQYGSEEWGEYLIREAHLSQRFVFDENGYYHCCASIPFPRKHGIRVTLLH